jgi:predicted nucleic acid-binding protein
MLTDTSFWIDLFREQNYRQKGPATSFLARYRAHELSVSVVTWGELAVGVERSGDLEKLLWRVRIHFLPLQVAWYASRIDRDLASKGQRLGENDNWIAATALAYGLRLVTNDEDFKRVPKLHRVSYA